MRERGEGEGEGKGKGEGERVFLLLILSSSYRLVLANFRRPYLRAGMGHSPRTKCRTESRC